MMKRKIYSFIFIACILVGCGGNEDESSIIGPKYIDISDLSVYKGSAEGGVEVVSNNIKNTDLASRYFNTIYDPKLYSKITLDFNGNKLTYTVKDGIKIVSEYTFRNDSLFIIKSDKEEIFIALGNSPELLYRKRGMVRYPLPTGKDTIYATDEHINLGTVLKLARYNSLTEFTKADTIIAWCNMTYIFD